MKEYSKLYRVLIILTSSCSLIMAPAYANSNDDGQPKRVVRVTNGIAAVQGWEQNLVKTNPNLARWHWDPIYSYTQGYAKLPVQSARPDTAKAARPVYNYPVVNRPDDRPTHISFSPTAIEEVRKNRVQPVNQAPVAQPKHDEQIFGLLTQHSKDIPVVEPTTEPILATYGNVYSRKESLGTSLNYSSQHTAVYGQLLKNQEKFHYNTAHKKHVN